MTLIVFCGFPCSGKTRRTKELIEKLKSSKENLGNIHIVDDKSLNVTREAYSNETDEKKVRGAVLSAVERLLTKKDIVIVDCMNYIKGLRYQLYCIARAIGTNHIVVRQRRFFSFRFIRPCQPNFQRNGMMKERKDIVKKRW
jgi:protein KTI12